MKTIEQIFKENGETLPFKITRDGWGEGVFETVFAKATNGDFITEDADGVPDVWVGNDISWELYKEPKVEEKRYEWLVFYEGAEAFTSDTICTEKKAKEKWSDAIKLVPQRELDEVTDKLVEVKL
jgi:hypothetical protein